ncbi:MAG TPA: SDR family oxidoreductase [Candidatus Cybelea sp.]|nr:SDR family oxidoreductase [Candidatus Cybelea sp.]
MTTPFARYPSLKDRSVLVTGGASGIGASIVEHFAEQGARVAFIDMAEAEGEALVDRVAKAGHAPPLFLKADLRETAALRAGAADAAARNGVIRVLVNNAARDDRHDTADVTPEYWDERMATNLRHMFFAAQAVVPGMIAAGGGAIVNFSSISFMRAAGDMPVYVTAKSAVIGLTRSLARDFGKHNIRVNTVVPGWIMTERQIALWLTPEGERELLAGQCLKEKLYPPDVARMVLWLSAEDSRLVSAQSFIVDGGWA